MVCLSTSPSACTNAISVANVAFDVEMAIVTFLADPSRTSCQLPCSLNAEQRKHVKKVVEQYDDLTCESFGMGKERTMHLFKQKLQENALGGNQISDSSPHRVTVKNTFIDDWIDAESTPTDERVVQSMPHNMFGRCLKAEISGHGLSATQSDESATSPPVKTELRWSDAVVEEQTFTLGTEVVIDGLLKAPVFNGARGSVHSWDAESGRYNVLLASPTPTGQRWAKIKGENLREL